MQVEYLGLIGLLLVGVGSAFFLYALSNRLRKNRARTPDAGESSPDLASDGLDGAIGPSTSRYFFIAIVGLMLHAGSLYFYMWGATVRQAGLQGLMVMLGFGMCLMMGVFYSWARGAVSSATEPEDETPMNLLDASE